MTDITQSASDANELTVHLTRGDCAGTWLVSLEHEGERQFLPGLPALVLLLQQLTGQNAAPPRRGLR
jgi:hypothetical protein